MKKTQLFENVSEILSICIFLSGSVVLIGWIFDIPVLKSVSPEFVTMKANTAICFILIGLSLWLSQEKRADNRLCRGIARLCASVVFLIGFLTFWQYLLGWDFGIDQLLFKEPATAILTSAPGRMAFNTSILFAIIGIVLFMAGSKKVLFSYPAQLLVIPAGIIALLSFVGYLYGASPLYIGLKFSTAMAVHTCVLFIMSCIGCLFARPQQGLMKDISSDDYGGLMLRRILPAVIFVPLVLGWFKIYGEHTKWFSNEFGVSLVAICNLLIVSLFVYILSVYLNRMDAKRKQAEEETRRSYDTQAVINKLLLLSLENITLHDTLEKAIDQITSISWLSLESKGAIFLVEDEPEALIMNAQRGLPIPLQTMCARVSFGRCMCGQAASSGEIVFADHVNSRHENRCESISSHGHYCIPILSAGKVLGVINAYVREGHRYDQKEEEFLRTVANAVAGIIERNKAQQRQTQLLERLESTVTQLNQSNKELREFAHLAAHDLKTPLRGIGTLAEWLVHDYHDKFDEQGQKQIGLLVKRVRRMDNLINATLQYSTIIRNKQNECRPDLNTLLRAVIAEIKPPPNIKISVNKDLPVVICEEEHIYQVFHQLLVNAVRFMDKADGRVTIDCADEDKFWRFSISDNGPGIEPQHFEKIFQLFQTLGNRDESENTGVGLALVKKIVELYGGRIWLISQPGQGATFNFTLPKQPFDANRQTPQPTAALQQQ
jgi:signal transduction histidine kinase